MTMSMICAIIANELVGWIGLAWFDLVVSG